MSRPYTGGNQVPAVGTLASKRRRLHRIRARHGVWARKQHRDQAPFDDGEALDVIDSLPEM